MVSHEVTDIEFKPVRWRAQCPETAQMIETQIIAEPFIIRRYAQAEATVWCSLCKSYHRIKAANFQAVFKSGQR